jgi:small GTP-binding protein
MSSPRRFKVIFLGDYGVGKTSLIRVRCGYKFELAANQTLGIDNFIVSCRRRDGGGQVELLIWDTAGQEQYHSMIPVYLRQASVIVLVGSISDEHSLRNIADYWVPWIHTEADGLPIIVAVNKIDLSPDATLESVFMREEIDRVFAAVCYTSALTGEGIEGLFDSVTDAALTRRPMTTDIREQTGEPTTNCC